MNKINKTTSEKKPVGRPVGYSPGETRKLTHQVGAYEWDSKKLNDKIIRGSKTACWDWQGSSNEFSNLFGIYKNGKNRMIQANRVIFMEHTGEDVSDKAIRMRCHNKHCCNFFHFEVVPNPKMVKTTKKGKSNE